MMQDKQRGLDSTAGFQAALDQLWTRFEPEIWGRVSILETAATACAAQQLTTELREAANAAAHKLAGTLGTFSLARGTELAREFEQLTLNDNLTDPALCSRLSSIASELHSIIASRKPG